MLSSKELNNMYTPPTRSQPSWGKNTEHPADWPYTVFLSIFREGFGLGYSCKSCCNDFTGDDISSAPKELPYPPHLISGLGQSLHLSSSHPVQPGILAQATTKGDCSNMDHQVEQMRDVTPLQGKNSSKVDRGTQGQIASPVFSQACKGLSQQSPHISPNSQNTKSSLNIWLSIWRSRRKYSRRFTAPSGSQDSIQARLHNATARRKELFPNGGLFTCSSW